MHIVLFFFVFRNIFLINFCYANLYKYLMCANEFFYIKLNKIIGSLEKYL